MLIDELIEKAFSDGYEYALMGQREFSGSIRRTKKLLKEGDKLVKTMENRYPGINDFTKIPLDNSKFRERSSRIINNVMNPRGGLLGDTNKKLMKKLENRRK